ncbi:MAG: acryloyl-CoA reductase [Rhodothermaceae bacterium]|nr:acryloyl-CoA reductase [Rhodothermaceae bacterium]MYB92100.1 acryloyl-CoA reductase [Rhodothermaceae bacterium]MYD69018.1 acryloyl-CoA reductase [Rhodothermaceae bacterium]MYG43849.1 acryloyl-CoA reductase [Rhodothermaceae bacterium]MYH11311.1 acryloyl-CoA reductase [Rhodothermaceae bacterium]
MGIEPFIISGQYKALILTVPGKCSIEQRESASIADGSVIIEVEYSGINYKDALAITGTGKIVRAPFPFVPGIDLAGIVLRSELDGYAPGDRVVLTGGGLGESCSGGYSQLQSVTPEYLLKLPEGMSTRTSMILGTAGLTAMLSVMSLEDHRIMNGEILVTGASGGVGMIAVKLLAGLGYTVIASCDSSHLWHKISGLGASRTIGRIKASRPLEHALYDGVIDAAGGKVLAAALAKVRRHGCIAASGNAAGTELTTTVYPFILRGITLAGIDSNTASMQDRLTAWRRLHALIPEHEVDQLSMGTVGLEDIESVCRAKMQGKAPGRFLVDLNSKG